MNGPLRLRESGGASERLLDSASLDRPTYASRQRALGLAATAGAFVTTTAGAAAAAKGSTASALYKSVAMWICIGAVAGGTIAFIGSSLFDPATDSGSSAARPPATPLVVPEPVVAPSPQGAEKSSDIAAEPPRTPAKSPARAVAAPPVPSVAPVAPPLPPAPNVAKISDREREGSELAAAREALARGDKQSAMKVLDTYDATHPNGLLRAESAALRQAVSNTGSGVVQGAPMTNSSSQGVIKQPMSGGGTARPIRKDLDRP